MRVSSCPLPVGGPTDWRIRNLPRAGFLLHPSRCSAGREAEVFNFGLLQQIGSSWEFVKSERHVARVWGTLKSEL